MKFRDHTFCQVNLRIYLFNSCVGKKNPIVRNHEWKCQFFKCVQVLFIFIFRASHRFGIIINSDGLKTLKSRG